MSEKCCLPAHFLFSYHTYVNRFYLEYVQASPSNCAANMSGLYLIGWCGDTRRARAKSIPFRLLYVVEIAELHATKEIGDYYGDMALGDKQSQNRYINWQIALYGRFTDEIKARISAL